MTHMTDTTDSVAASPAAAAPTTIRLSIIVVSWNVRDLLRDCLASVARESLLPPDAYEVIVVDNASHDGSPEMVRTEFPWARLIANDDNRGFGWANNQALPLCRAPIVLLLNPDTVVLEHALDHMLATMDAQPDIGALGCRLLNTDGSLQRWTAGASPTVWRTAVHTLFLDKFVPSALLGPRLYLADDEPHDRDVAWISGACLALRCTALDGRLFDERFFMYGEDLELCHRIADDGWRVVYTPGATVIHHHGKSTQQSEDALLAGLKGPRAFYRMRNGSAAVPLWDAVTAMGFLARAIAWSGAAALGRQSARGRAAACWRFFNASLRVLTGR